MIMATGIHQTILWELKQADIERPVRRLYAEYFESVVAQICGQGGHREDGADVFQEAVLVLIEKVKTGGFREESSIGTFLSAIARNLWLHELRTRDRRKKREKRYMGDLHPTAETEGGFFQKHTSSALETLMQEIGDVCRRLLRGFYYEEKRMRELLVEFDYENEQVLRNKKSKCMKKLKERLQGNPSLIQELTSISLYEQ
jgi:RNA polymerase sigma factor (sigma-70 family)